MTYMKHSVTLSGWFAWASFQALVYALFPFWFVTSSTFIEPNVVDAQ